MESAPQASIDRAPDPSGRKWIITALLAMAALLPVGLLSAFAYRMASTRMHQLVATSNATNATDGAATITTGTALGRGNVSKTAIDQTAGRHARQRDDDGAGRDDQADGRRIEPQRTRQVERPDHQRRHHHRRDERVHGEARIQPWIAEHRQLDQR